MNKQALKLTGFTEKDFEKWCLENNKPSYLTSSKREFFRRIIAGTLIKDSRGKIKRSKRGKK